MDTDVRNKAVRGTSDSRARKSDAQAVDAAPDQEADAAAEPVAEAPTSSPERDAFNKRMGLDV